ncbi:hypothetical protein HKBW3S43_00853 [Candidatus Hakubella thermalkaliphila]|uniref:Transposase n=2 Tax=Candidatus Hakubella thermalkaliphila TaxID=2754717 RepID=A0A6V8P8K3_9ACTN|nr:hypothetical protein HKBW3S06_00738 [Candidatus Hakubella thermalkaliphila]GFP25058.1 hypothetical protein HKBW3S25_00508 [Candidatus Hakubella thermalkaliphila]GFP28004.1 hypothetical protein HKBW3S33_01421 [Candidatus Hakubella thermalkaliphila]GFP35061.1 hypothetical protein HKBW3S43_00853 [Candidatus Hakubella thermalkaliphila]
MSRPTRDSAKTLHSSALINSKLYKTKYLGFGPTLANEKLFEIDGIKIGRQTLRNWLIGAQKQI